MPMANLTPEQQEDAGVGSGHAVPADALKLHLMDFDIADLDQQISDLVDNVSNGHSSVVSTLVTGGQEVVVPSEAQNCGITVGMSECVSLSLLNLVGATKLRCM